MHFFVVILEGHTLQAKQLELFLTGMFHRAKLGAAARWYYDEFAESGTEYGVRVDVQGLSRQKLQELAVLIVEVSSGTFGELQVQFE